MKYNFKKLKNLTLFTLLYLIISGAVFWQTANLEFLVYIVVILAIFGIVLATLHITNLKPWMLWLLSFWGLMHVLGGLVPTSDGILFEYRIFTFLDLGGEFYILKYDQFVHFYLYGIVAIMAHHILTNALVVKGYKKTVDLLAILISLGISGLNEIMEFLVSLNFENGVGGYDNTMLDLCFNFAGALIFVLVYLLLKKSK